MIERKDIRALQHVAETEGASCRITPEMLAELLRVYALWLDAPVGNVGAVECEGGDKYCAEVWTNVEASNLCGQRVRLLPAGGE